MLTKPLTHLRPLLRLPSHTHTASGPEHFSANPSIVHHLPQSGSTNALVGSAQGAASTSGGSSGNAGRAGWAGSGPGAGSGGYTGHARAFLSLPQTTLGDSTSLSSTDDTSNERRRRLSLRKRLLDAQGRQTRTVTLVDGPGRAISRQIGAREGSGKVALVELESGQVVAVEPGQTRGRRSSIAFPTSYASAIEDVEPSRSGEVTPTAVTPTATPLSSRSSTPTPHSSRSRQPLTRSRTTLDLWRVGVPHASAVVPARALSTRSQATPLPEISELDRPKRHTRVIQDLAGLDLPLPRLGHIRRNSSTTASKSVAEDVQLEAKSAHTSTPIAETSDSVSEDLYLDEESVSSQIEAEIEAEEATQGSSLGEKSDVKVMVDGKGRDPAFGPFGRALVAAARARDVNRVKALIRYYRTPPGKKPRDSKLAAEFPLYPKPSHRIYELCIETLLLLRQPGHAIAPILDIYNEMIERDVIPTMRAYALVVTALCNRERDIYAAANRAETTHRWQQWGVGIIGTPDDSTPNSAADEAQIGGYLAEKNLPSAIRLFNAALAMRGEADKHGLTKFEGRNQIVMLNQILATIAASPEPDADAAMNVYRRIPARALENLRQMYRYLFTILGKAGDKERLNEVWEDFERTRKQGHGMSKENWKEMELETGRSMFSESKGSFTVLEHHRRTLNAYLDALIRCGEHEKAISMVERIIDPPADLDPNELPVPPGVHHPMFGQLVVSLAQAGHAEAAMSWFNRAKELDQRTSNHALPISFPAFVDATSALLLAGEWRKAYQMHAGQYRGDSPDRRHKKNTSSSVYYTTLERIYIAILSAASAARSDPAQVDEILSHLPPMLQSCQYNPPSEIVLTHMDLLIDLNRQHDLVTLVGCWYLEGRRIPLAIQSFSKHLDALLSFIKQRTLAEQFTILNCFAALHVPAAYQIAIETYLEARGSVDSPSKLDMTPASWHALYSIFALLSVEDGSYDEALIMFTTDLKVLVEVDHKLFGSIPLATLNHLGRTFTNTLYERFGRDRAAEMISPLTHVILPDALSPVEVPEEVATTPSEVTAAPPEATTPSTDPTSASTPPQPSAPTTPDLPSPISLYFDEQISQRVDLHTWRAPPITPRQAYDAIQTSIRTSGAAPFPEAIGRLMNNLARAGDEFQVRELYALGQHLVATHDANTPEQSRKWQVMEDAMLSSMCFLGHLEEAGMHRARIIGAGLVPSPDSYATMIACSKDTTDDALVARELYDESQRLGIRPNLYLYNTIISKLSKARKAELAIDLFKQMKKARIDPSSVTYGAVINACCRVGDAESAATLFEEMSAMPRFRPRVPPYNTMMQFHLNTAPSRDRILYYYGRLQQHRVPPSAHTYKLLMDAYASLPPMDLKAVERVFADLCADRKVPVQGNHWASLISAYGLYAGDVARALQVFDSIPSHRNAVDLSKEPVVWEAILNVLSQRGTLEQLEEMRNRLIASGARATAYVYNVLISGYARHGQLDTARSLFASLGDSVTGVAAPNNHPVLLTSSGHVKPATTTDVPTDIVYREPSTYEAMINAELAAGNVPEAEEVLKLMEERRYPVAVFMRVKAIVDAALISIATQAVQVPQNDLLVAAQQKEHAQLAPAANFS